MATTTPTTRQMSRMESLQAGWRDFKRSIIWRLMIQQRPWMIGLLALYAFRTVIFTLWIGNVRLIIDGAIIEHTVPLGPTLQRFFILSVINFITGMASEQIGDKIGWTIEYELRNWVYDRIQRIPPKKLDSLSTGQLLARTGSDLNALELFIRFLPAPIFGVIFLGAGLITIFSINWWLSIITLGSLPASIWVVRRIRKRLWGYTYLRTNQGAVVTQAFDEPVRGIRVLKAYGREDEARKRMDDVSRLSIVYRMTLSRFQAKYDIVMDVIPAGFRAVVFVMGAFLVVSWGQMTVGTFLVFISTSRALVGVISGFDEIMGLWYWARTAIGRVQELITWAPADRLRRDLEELPPPSSGLELRDVSVTPDGRRVLEDIDLRVRPGEMAVVTGTRGSGKSALAAVVAGELAPETGQAKLDGIEVKRLDPSDLRSVVRVLDEDGFLFARTLRSNLLMGGAGFKVDDVTIERALYAAHATEIVEELDQGLDTVLGPQGMTLSGGQRQRIALARALIEPPRVLVLDDALSALPPATEVEVLRRIRSHAPQTAVVCLTRRPGPETIADTVIELPAAPPAVEARLAARDQQRLADSIGEAGIDVDVDVDEADTGILGRSVQRTEGQQEGLRDGPYDPRLVETLAGITLSNDKPVVKEHHAADAVTPPKIFKTLAPLKGRVALTALVLLAFTIVGLFPERITGLMTDALEQEDLGKSITFGLAYLGVGLLLGIARAAFRIYSSKVDANVLYLLRRRLFQRLTTLGVDYYDREPPGQIATRAVVDLYTISRFAEQTLFNILTTSSLFIFSLAAAFFFAPGVAPIALIFIPVLALVTGIQMPFLDRAYRKARERKGDTLNRLHEDFHGRYIIRATGAERESREQYGDLNWQVRAAEREAATIKNVFGEIVQFVGRLSTIAIYARAGDLVITGAMTIGLLVSAEAYIDDAMDRVPRLGRYWQEWLRTRVSFRKLNELYEAPILPDEPPDPRPLPPDSPVDGGFSFENVTFAYPHTGRTVLADVTLEVAPGDVIALVGPTGAGKSSIAKLINRIYDPTEGTIRLDGTDLRDLSSADYRQRIGVVPQDDFMFRGNVWDNIGYARPGSSQEDIETAALAVGAYDELLSIPGGAVEEEGRNLTQAQRQLISLSRAWLVSPDIIVLDEATSSLSSEAEQKVLDAFLGLGRTTILVTHKREVAQRADLIVVIDNGRVVQAGTDEELIADDGPYANLWVREPVGVGGRGANGRGANGRATGGRKKAKATAKTSSKSAGKSKKAAAADRTTVARKVTAIAKKQANGNGAAKARRKVKEADK